MEILGRLKKRAEFLAAASGRRFRTDRMTVQGRVRDPDGLGVRVGLTVTKRVGNAVERNRIKRRLRVAVKLAATAAMGRNADVVVIARRDVLSVDFTSLVDDLQRAFAIVTKPGSGLKRPRSSPQPAPTAIEADTSMKPILGEGDSS